MNLYQQFMAARQAGTPLIAIKTLDPEATMQALQMTMGTPLGEGMGLTPIIQYDCINGWQCRNSEGQQAIDSALNGSPIEKTVNAVEMLVLAKDLPFDRETPWPTNPVVFVLNAHTYLSPSYGDRAGFIQALWNLRMPFRDSLRTVVLLGPDFDLPPEILHDILMLDEPMPTEAELTKIVSETCEAAEIKAGPEVVTKAVDAVRGLVAFEAEQAVAMCISPATGSLDTSELWQRKRTMISSHKALTVWVGGQKFDDLGGIEEIKRRHRRIIKGKRPIRLVLWIDEIEKTGLANAGGDLSGTSSDQLGTILTEMQDKDYTGILLVGAPGAAKSAFAKAIANESGCITIKLDLGASMGEGLVGQAQNEIRSAFKIVEAVGGIGGVYVVATSNDIRVVKPELKRRFKRGIWFFDLPTKEERDIIWEIYFNKYPEVDRAGREKVKDENWTGAEIETCVSTAWEEGVSLLEASRSIIPYAVSGKDDLDRLRREASGRYNSASYQGVYQQTPSGPQTQATGARKFARGEATK